MLATPLKRINQYEFWIEVMFTHTSTTDPDYQDLEDALRAISELSEVVTKSNTKATEMQQIIDVQKKLSDYEVEYVLRDVGSPGDRKTWWKKAAFSFARDR